MIKDKKTRVAVFDIDGTLLNTMPKLDSDVKGAFQRLGYTVTTQDIRSNKSWYNLTDKLGISKEDFDREFDKRKSWEESLRDGEAPLFEDVLPCLEEIAGRGVILAALTKSDPKYTKAKLDHHGLNRYFGGFVAVTPVTSRSKDVEGLDLIRKIGKCSIEQVHFIGDRAEDVLVSDVVEKELAVPSYGIYLNRAKSQTPPELSKYRVVSSLSEVPSIVLS